MIVRVLMSPGCGNGERTSKLVADLVQELAPRATVEIVLVATPEDAVQHGFPGSPTVRVNGEDIEQPPPTNVGLG